MTDGSASFDQILDEAKALLEKASPEERKAFLAHVGIPPHRPGGSVRYSLVGIKGVGVDAAAHIVDVRSRGGPFRSVADFASRIDTKIVNRKAMEGLIKAGALDGLNPNRAELYENLDVIMSASRHASAARDSGTGSLI